MLGAGQHFAGYTIERLLGAGGMGEVYLAQHPRLPRREALKILKADISNDDSFRQRFIREADSIAALEHPNIVTVHDRGESEDRLWIATQYVDGADAAQLLRERYPAGMPVDEVIGITAAIADALDYAHGKGLLHRDVKPANILLAQPDPVGNRRTYLADFGIARPLDDPTGLTVTNFTLGTVAYAAPEQLMGKAIDGRADQYALAATAYHLLTGRPVYSDSNPVAVISQHLAETAPPPSTVRPELAPFDAAFARALAKKPQDRFPRCQDFADALATAAGPAGYSASAPTQEAPVPPRESTAREEPFDINGLFAENPGAEAIFSELFGRSPSAASATKPAHKQRKNVLTAAGAAVGVVIVAGALMWHPWSDTSESSTATATSTLPTTTVAVATSTTTVTLNTTPSAAPSSTAQPVPPVTAQESIRPTAVATQPNEAAFLAAANGLPMYVRLSRFGGDADLLKEGYQACAALDAKQNALQAAYVLFPSGNEVGGAITDDGMNVLRYSATYLCPRNQHLFYD